MTSSPADFRCSTASRDDGEHMAGTAPTETAWLLLEYAGSWGRKAVAESRLPEEVRSLLDGLAGVRVQLIRRHGGAVDAGPRVFTASLGRDPRVETAVLDDVRDVLDLDVAALAAGGVPGLAPYDGPLWLVCTNGRRDRCCAETGRPIAAALAERWPEATWETTHLGGHRFAGTLVALPTGVTLGRLDAASAVVACGDLAEGSLPLDRARGRAGLPGPAQVAELHLRARARRRRARRGARDGARDRGRRRGGHARRGGRDVAGGRPQPGRRAAPAELRGPQDEGGPGVRRCIMGTDEVRNGDPLAGPSAEARPGLRPQHRRTHDHHA